MGIVLPYGSGNTSRLPFNRKPFVSRETRLRSIDANAGGNVEGFANLDVHISKTNKTKKAAVCIPSQPIEHCKLESFGSDLALRQWWDEWRQNISVKCGWSAARRTIVSGA